MSPQARSLVAPALATLVAFILLVGLGVWQLHRLSWKEGLIAEIDARAHAAPAALPPAADWSALRPNDYEYRHVALSGTFDNAKETLVFRPSEDGPGYLVMTPLALAAGGTVIVNRGWVPDRLKDHAARAAGDRAGPVTVTGLMRAPEARNLFTPADDAATGQFFTKDPTTIAAHDGIAAAPFIVDADATPVNPGGWPRGGATVIDIPNNHFSYAMTWFGIALTLLGVFGSFAWKRLKGEAEPAAPRGPASAGAG